MKYSFSICALVSFGLLAEAQIVTSGNQTGLPLFGVMHGSDIDQVSLENGNLHVSLPIVSVPQRRSDLTINFVYNSPSWKVREKTSLSTVVSEPVDIAAGWHVRDNQAGWSIDYSTDIAQCGDQGGTPYYAHNFYKGFMVVDPQGTKHPVGVTWETGTPETACWGSRPRGYTLDGSGILLDISQWSQNEPAPGITLLTLRDGTQVTLGNTLLKDSNGNTATLTTDYLGRTLLSDTQGPTTTYVTPLGQTINGPAYDLWTMYDSNGQLQNFRLDYQAIDIHTSECTPQSQPPCYEVQEIWLEPSSLTLPDQHAYHFTWQENGYGDLQRIDLPTGGHISYTYVSTSCCSVWDDSSLTTTWFSRRAVTSRTVGGVDGEHTWTYDILGHTITDPLGNRQVYDFEPVVVGSSISGTAYEKQVQTFDSSGNLLRTTTKTYAAEVGPSGQTAGSTEQVINIRAASETTTLENGLSRRTETDYETLPSPDGLYTATFLNPIERRDYDFGGTLLRRTTYSYLHQNNQVYLNDHMVNRLTNETVWSGANILAQTLYEYDVYTTTADGCPRGIESIGNPVNHDAAFGDTYTVRGNRTAVTQWRNIDGKMLTSCYKYDQVGNIIAATDPNRHTTEFDFSDSWSNSACAPSNADARSYVSQTKDALGHLTRSTWFSCTGLLGSATDANNRTTSYTYDLMHRPSTVSYPDGGATTFSYPDANTMRKQQKIDGTRWTDVYVLTDGLGRESRRQVFNDEASKPDRQWDQVDTCYDALGRKSFVSYVYQGAGYGNNAKVCSGAGDAFGYDALNRVTQVRHGDGATIDTAYAGRASQTTDEGNGSSRVQRISQTDGLGRLAYVCEVSSATLTVNGDTPSSCGLDITANGFLTSYSYDALSNLTRVQQPGLTDRVFIYDSLSQLTSAYNPESNTTGYAYDDDGLLYQRTRPAPNQGDPNVTATTTYSYNAVHQPLWTTYSDTSTPNIERVYEESNPWGHQATNVVGRLTTEVAHSRTGGAVIAGDVFYTYDEMGRVKANGKCTPRTCGSGGYDIYYNYDALGDMLTISDGVGSAFAYCYNSAGRVIKASTWPFDCQGSGDLLSDIRYGPFGTESGSLGNGINTSYGYDGRGRLISRTDTGPSPATAGSGSVTFSGSDRSTQVLVQAAAAGSGSLTVNGSEQSKQVLVQNATTAQGNVTISGGEQSKQVLVQAATSGTGSVTINGSEQSKQVQTQPATQSTATITISGYEDSVVIETCSDWNEEGTCRKWDYQTVYDSGTVTVTVNGFTAIGEYGWYTTDSSSDVASRLASAFNTSSSPVTAYASGSNVYITSKAYGSSVNYAMSTSSSTGDPADFGYPSFTASVPSNMSGGHDATYTTVYDAGNVTISVNGHSNSASWSNGSTAAGIASSLASNINADGGASVTASPSGSAVYLTAKSTGAATNYSLSSSYAYDSGDFGSSSFTTSNSSTTLTGGQDASYNTIYDSGSVTITVNGHPNLIGWGQGATSSGIASALASNINADAGAYETASASGGTLYLTSKITGAAANYSLSSSYAYDSSNFSSSSFTTANSGSALTGGRDAGYNTIYDSGTLSLLVNGHTDSVNWDQSSTSSTIASALASAINGDSGASVTATASSNVVSLTAKTTGASTNYSLSSSYSYDSADFGASSFTGSSASALSGGLDATYNTVFDTGTVSVTVNGLNKAVSYGQSTTASGIASALASTFNGDTNSSVSASASGGQVTFTAKSTGAATNYSLSASSGTATIDVRFTNDSCSGCGGGTPVGGGDRNLFVNSITIGSTNIPPNDPSVSYTSCNQYYNGTGTLACSGDMLSTSPAAVAGQSITVNAYGSPDYNIYPHMQLWVNGAMPGEWDVTGTAQNYTVTIPNTSPTFTGTSFPTVASGSTLSGGADRGASASTFYAFNIKVPGTENTGYAPNGNVLFAQDSVNGDWTYTYDDFNRLLTAVSANTGQGCSWEYDRYGNRWHQNPYNGSCNAPQLGFTGGNNRVDGANLYDAAGNLIQDPLNTNIAYRYDAENRLTEVWQSGNLVASYTYDAEGRRISGPQYEYLYNLGGNAITVLDKNNGAFVRGELYAPGRHIATYQNGTRYFVHADWLGTERKRTAIDGGPYSEWTSLPFGEGSSTPNPGPTHFTGKERDPETGLDYFDARYYGSSTGRFMTPDWAARPTTVPYADLGDPQSLNLYGYVGNNPVSRTDPFGHEPCVVDGQKHGSVWCWAHKHHLFKTKHERAERVREEFREYGLTVYKKGEEVDLSKASDQEVLQIQDELIRQRLQDALFGLNLSAPSIPAYPYVEKPSVTDPKLQEIVDELYQPTDTVPGGTAGAVRYERITGKLLSPKGHGQEAQEIISRLNKFLKNNPGISANDQAMGKAIIEDLQNALAGK